MNNLRGEAEDRYYRIDRYEGERLIRSLWIDPAGDRLIRIQAFTERGAISYTADFMDHARLGTGVLPRRLAISADGVSVALRYTDMDLREDDEESFTLPIPEGITPVFLEGR